jgi:fatty acyl-CoA reductase
MLLHTLNTSVFPQQLFDKLKSTMSLPEILTKVHAVAGDCSYKGLNISQADRAMITDNTSLIFHFAATVNFTEKFKKAIELNVRGTREMIKLALECQHLQLFCQVSTAFSHLHAKHLEEIAYAAPADAQEMIEVAEKFSEDEVEAMLSRYLCESVPNTYVFTKSLSETLVVKAYEDLKLPAVIVRPAIILQMYQSPIPGWTDNLYNITGVMTAAGAGILRVFRVKKGAELNITCVDYTIGNIMSATWHYLRER